MTLLAIGLSRLQLDAKAAAASGQPLAYTAAEVQQIVAEMERAERAALESAIAHLERLNFQPATRL
ncbi:hypothetical protein Sp245p_26425 (plasmid) [Azospirillum baldaniorum]|uniref:Uncharacterized protein n=1 Tax=Azospirillum baldaniorum TaxID=1064539 RepID=A0A9P1JZT6_9PROT|nr:hypothetical protein [Azospirillum baldaniorum]AWJ93265.1 hypothetical protein Sp245p_25925 [Azospirillum baldaniorum]AWJ93360.1 hypothetical protein Sp245p_26425 [Azospirillum baldaniorum]TWA77959.1 hypothetical protein FBZ85_106119 [Azospirillum brasilense]CCD02941.1 protein of unknown function [Azospirillum baldaniorum]